jgi:hypothetical protein
MHREGNEVHAEVDEARAGSTPNIVRWVLGISLLAAILLLSAIWIFGAATTDEGDRVANVTDRMENTQDGEATDSIVSGDDQFEFGDTARDADETAAAPATEGEDSPQANATPE